VLASLGTGSCVVIAHRRLALLSRAHTTGPIVAEEGDMAPWFPRPSEVAMWWLLATLSYYSTGHSSTFGSVHISAAFIGMDEFHFGISGTVLALNTWSGPLLHCIALGTVFEGHFGGSEISGGAHAHRMAGVRIVFAACSALMVLFMMLCLIVLRHHLFLWAVFAPKYVFLAATHLVYLVVLGVAECLPAAQRTLCWLAARGKNKHE
jgi:hypothetical protein